MKKFLLIATSVLLFSCSTDEELETSTISGVTAKEMAFQKAKKEGLKQSPSDGVTFKCGSTSYLDPINVNPNYPYISNFEVMYHDSTPLSGTNQITLSEFVAKALFNYGGPGVGIGGPGIPATKVFIGYNAYNDFLNAGVSFDYMQEYGYGQDADNASFYGDIFPTNNTPMTNDAANTVYHHLKPYVDQFTNQGKRVVAVHLYTSSLLCIPSGKFIKMTIKVK